MDDVLAEFLAETLESLTLLEIEVMRLERDPKDAPTLAGIFRHVHTIKGTCGFLGLQRLARVTDAVEGVLERHRDGTLPVTPGTITLVLQALDTVRAIVEAVEDSGAEPPGNDAALVSALADIEPAPRLPPLPARPAEAATHAPAAPTIRVAVELLDRLMTLTDDLVLTRSQILHCARTQPGLTGPLQRLAQITDGLVAGVMKARMQPIGSAWSTLPRLVRRVALDLGKAIRLDMRGAGTLVDGQVLDAIKGPLSHMVRNSADHGIEPPAERRAAGKPELGRIYLSACREGGHIVIALGDDGRGLPMDRIRQKAVERGLASEADVAVMEAQHVQSFIFRAGFSTAQAVTPISGRGVGMDVVKASIERLGGTVAVASQRGVGTTFTLRIPLAPRAWPGAAARPAPSAARAIR